MTALATPSLYTVESSPSVAVLAFRHLRQAFRLHSRFHRVPSPGPALRGEASGPGRSNTPRTEPAPVLQGLLGCPRLPCAGSGHRPHEKPGYACLLSDQLVSRCQEGTQGLGVSGPRHLLCPLWGRPFTELPACTLPAMGRSRGCCVNVNVPGTDPALPGTLM